MASRGGAPEIPPEITGVEDRHKVPPYHTLQEYDTWKKQGGIGEYDPQANSSTLGQAAQAEASTAQVATETPGKSRRSMQMEEMEDVGVRKGNRTSIMMKLEEMETKIITKKAWIQSTQADCVFGSAILLNAIMLGVSVDQPKPSGMDWTGWIIESIFLIIFAVEIVLRIQCLWPNWRSFFDAWGCFDLFVTVLSCLDNFVLSFVFASADGDNDASLSAFTVLRIFRLFRLIRIVRVLRMFRELIVMIRGLSDSFKSVGWMSLLLLIIMYTGSIILVILIGQPLGPENEDLDFFFGNTLRAMYSHFMIVTLEGWIGVCDSLIVGSHWGWGIYVIVVICFTNLVLLNLMVGCIVERIIVVAQEQENEASEFTAESKQFKKTLNTLFQQSDMDNNGSITYQELKTMLERGTTKDIFDAFGLNIDIPPQVLYTIMHLNKDDNEITTFQEFFDSCLRLCGSKSNIHSLFVQHDVCRWHDELLASCEKLQGKVFAAVELYKSNPKPALIPTSGSAQSEPAPDDIERAATSIQSVYRGGKERSQVKVVHEQKTKAATTIQSNYRGRKDRNAVKELRTEAEILDDQAVIEDEAQAVIEGGMTLAEEAHHLEELRRRMARCEAAQAQALDDLTEMQDGVHARNRFLSNAYEKAKAATKAATAANAILAQQVPIPKIALPAAAAAEQENGVTVPKGLEACSSCNVPQK